jgi:alkylation response protein AidB-like acyl-CoA dehydrogenase
MTDRYLPSQLGQEVADAVYEIASEGTAEERWSPAGMWTELVNGGWTQLADGPEPGVDGDLSLFDLSVMAESWGRALVGLPLLTTLAARRWMADRPDPSVGLTFVIPEFDGFLIPYPAQSGLLIGPDGVLPLAANDDAPDDYAPSLPLAHPATELIVASPDVLRDYALLAVSEAVGAADRALIGAVDFAKTRYQFSRPIGSFQAIKHTLANMHCDVELARSGVTWFNNDPGELGTSAGTVLQMCSSVVERAIQVYGGIGYTWECDLHWSLRHIAQTHRVVMAALDAVADARPSQKQLVA